MPISMLFWFLMILALFVLGWANWPDRKGMGGSFLLWVILFLIGWHDFGFILK